MTADYVGAVVDAGYATDAAVAADTDLATWIGAASGTGNVAGLPRMESKAALKAVVTSVLYRITFHGMGRLRSIGTPLPTFAPNYPPCLQSTTIPDPQTRLSTADLLKTFLRTLVHSENSSLTRGRTMNCSSTRPYIPRRTRR